MQKNIFDKLNVEKLQLLNSTLGGIGGYRVKTLGYLKNNVEKDKLKCVADALVVQDKMKSNQAIIRFNVLMQGKTTINEKGITV